MKHFNTLLLAAIGLFSFQLTSAQTGTLCDGNKGPNLLGARGTFSIPYITPNTTLTPVFNQVAIVTIHPIMWVVH